MIVPRLHFLCKRRCHPISSTSPPICSRTCTPPADWIILGWTLLGAQCQRWKFQNWYNDHNNHYHNHQKKKKKNKDIKKQQARCIWQAELTKPTLVTYEMQCSSKSGDHSFITLVSLAWKLCHGDLHPIEATEYGYRYQPNAKYIRLPNQLARHKNFRFLMTKKLKRWETHLSVRMSRTKSWILRSVSQNFESLIALAKKNVSWPGQKPSYLLSFVDKAWDAWRPTIRVIQPPFTECNGIFKPIQLVPGFWLTGILLPPELLSFWGQDLTFETILVRS